ncbi:MAG TPA: 4-alpha-glucanotransferase, partial [Microlunatus sp.]|nr:4-alpha-glucanotransferase [Microlunatus sp.]
MSELDESLLELAQAYGIATEYWDWQGHHVAVAAETVIAVLAGLDVDASTTERAWEALAAHHREPWTRMLPRCVATREGHPYVIAVHVTDGDPVDIWVELESGAGRGMRQLENWTPAREIDGRWVGEASFEIPGDLPLGYHTVRARSGGQEAAMPLIITPAWLGIPERVGERRAWGLATQLYSVRSHDSWGVGDLADLADLAVWSGGEHGADYILINPLHAAEPVPPMEPSPYLPSTRRFFNPLYIRPDRIPEAVGLDES